MIEDLKYLLYIFLGIGLFGLVAIVGSLIAITILRLILWLISNLKFYIFGGPLPKTFEEEKVMEGITILLDIIRYVAKFIFAYIKKIFGVKTLNLTKQEKEELDYLEFLNSLSLLEERDKLRYEKLKNKFF